jgi:hypothetical protein
MTLQRLGFAFFAAALASVLVTPARAEQVFQNVSTGSLQALPTPTGMPLYDAYFWPCYYGNGRGGGRQRGFGGRGNSGIGTINGERFYPYDPRSTSGRGHGFNTWNCGYANHRTGQPPHPRPGPSRVPMTRPTPRS